MRGRLGEEFTASISGVAAFGVFVALDEVYVEGMVHVSELGNDYYQFDAARHQLLGERSGQRFRLGDRVRVKLARADLETTRLDFVLAAPGYPDAATTNETQRRRGAKGSTRKTRPGR